MPRTDDFQRIPLLRDLPEDERVHLRSVLKDLILEPGEVLFREGDPGGTLYLVVDGSLDVLKGLGTSDERSVARNGPGEFIGEMSLLIPGRARRGVRRGCRSDPGVLRLPIRRALFTLSLPRHGSYER
jgi:CRP-like cAMP-binding protein